MKKKSVRKGEPLGEELSNETQEKVRGGTSVPFRRVISNTVPGSPLPNAPEVERDDENLTLMPMSSS